jgi:hypothetical protein
LKKLLGIIVLGFFCCKVSFAEKVQTYVCIDINSPAVPLELVLVYDDDDDFGVGYLGNIPFLVDIKKYFYDFSLNKNKDTAGLTEGSFILSKVNGAFSSELTMKSGKILKMDGTCDKIK